MGRSIDDEVNRLRASYKKRTGKPMFTADEQGQGLQKLEKDALYRAFRRNS